MTWMCNVCGRTREDAKIDVRKVAVGDITVNVRYCNDTPACWDGAPDAKVVQSIREAWGVKA